MGKSIQGNKLAYSLLSTLFLKTQTTYPIPVTQERIDLTMIGNEQFDPKSLELKTECLFCTIVIGALVPPGMGLGYNPTFIELLNNPE